MLSVTGVREKAVDCSCVAETATSLDSTYPIGRVVFNDCSLTNQRIESTLTAADRVLVFVGLRRLF
jgi:hypothetical protein